MTPACEALRSAVLALSAHGALDARLESAHRLLESIDPERDLPESLRFRFQELEADISYGADTVAEAVSLMSAGDQERLAARIVGMFVEVMKGGDQGE